MDMTDTADPSRMGVVPPADENFDPSPSKPSSRAPAPLKRPSSPSFSSSASKKASTSEKVLSSAFNDQGHVDAAVPMASTDLGGAGFGDGISGKRGMAGQQGDRRDSIQAHQGLGATGEQHGAAFSLPLPPAAAPSRRPTFADSQRLAMPSGGPDTPLHRKKEVKFTELWRAGLVQSTPGLAMPLPSYLKPIRPSKRGALVRGSSSAASASDLPGAPGPSSRWKQSRTYDMVNIDDVEDIDIQFSDGSDSESDEEVEESPSRTSTGGRKPLRVRPDGLAWTAVEARNKQLNALRPELDDFSKLGPLASASFLANQDNEPAFPHFVLHHARRVESQAEHLESLRAIPRYFKNVREAKEVDLANTCSSLYPPDAQRALLALDDTGDFDSSEMAPVEWHDDRRGLYIKNGTTSFARGGTGVVDLDAALKLIADDPSHPLALRGFAGQLLRAEPGDPSYAALQEILYGGKTEQLHGLGKRADQHSKVADDAASIVDLLLHGKVGQPRPEGQSAGAYDGKLYAVAILARDAYSRTLLSYNEALLMSMTNSWRGLHFVGWSEKEGLLLPEVGSGPIPANTLHGMEVYTGNKSKTMINASKSANAFCKGGGIKVYISNTSSGTQEQYSVHLPTFFSAADNPRTGARVNLGASRSALVELGACPVPRRGADAIRNPEEIGAVGMDVDTLSFVFMVLGPNKQLIPITDEQLRKVFPAGGPGKAQRWAEDWLVAIADTPKLPRFKLPVSAEVIEELKRRIASRTDAEVLGPTVARGQKRVKMWQEQGLMLLDWHQATSRLCYQLKNAPRGIASTWRATFSDRSVLSDEVLGSNNAYLSRTDSEDWKNIWTIKVDSLEDPFNLHDLYVDGESKNKAREKASLKLKKDLPTLECIWKEGQEKAEEVKKAEKGKGKGKSKG